MHGKRYIEIVCYVNLEIGYVMWFTYYLCLVKILKIEHFGEHTLK